MSIATASSPSEGVVRWVNAPHEGAIPNSEPVVPSRTIDINPSSQDELETIPGVTQTIARRIIQGRTIGMGDDKRRLNGIGETRLVKIRPYLTAR